MPGPLSDAWIARRNQQRGSALEDLEEERGAPAWLGRQARGFGAGLIDPFGASGWALRGISHLAPGLLFPENARLIQGALNRAGDEAPTASLAGSLTGPGYGWARTLGHASRREAAELLGILWAGSSPLNHFYEAFSGAGRRREEERRAREYGAAGY